LLIVSGNPTIIIQVDVRLVALRPYLSVSLPFSFFQNNILTLLQFYIIDYLSIFVDISIITLEKLGK